MKHDLALLARYAENRSPDAFAELVKRYARKADAVRSSVSGWLHKAALNHALGAVRKAASRRHHEGEAMAETSKDTGPTWEEVTDRETRLKIVRTIESNPMCYVSD